MLNVLFGTISGIVSGMGIGGGAILITILVCFQNVDQKVAQATNLLFFIPTSIIATIINIKNKRIHFKQALLISIAGCVGSAIGAFTATKMDTNILKKAFGVFLILIAIYELYLWIKKYKNQNNVNEQNIN